jgi:hypothetical protein
MVLRLGGMDVVWRRCEPSHRPAKGVCIPPLLPLGALIYLVSSCNLVPRNSKSHLSHFVRVKCSPWGVTTDLVLRSFGNIGVFFMDCLRQGVPFLFRLSEALQHRELRGPVSLFVLARSPLIRQMPHKREARGLKMLTHFPSNRRTVIDDQDSSHGR